VLEFGCLLDAYTVTKVVGVFVRFFVRRFTESSINFQYKELAVLLPADEGSVE
jgi:hypothetical protein